ncbi:DUF1330 domain-containing protein [Jannaschia sp. R86511]|uniref:DUF1330 domain-containing protein n=1 Tax=Jannaschia sp. R86511 TaxID=3093853 RepID=UPI0036D3A4AD
MTSPTLRDRAAALVPRAYVVFDLTVTDPDAYETYRVHGQATVRRWGGRVLSGEPAPHSVVEVLEGDWPTRRLVIVEFPSLTVAHAWYASPEYRHAAALRQVSATGRVLLVEGWNPPW